jgi:hypothetical protein
LDRSHADTSLSVKNVGARTGQSRPFWPFVEVCFRTFSWIRVRQAIDNVLRGTDPYDRAMATATPSPTPNPNAMKFMLDVSLPSTMNVMSAQAASGDKFAEAIFSAGGVASLFGVNDFVTVTREPEADWDPIVAAVEAAAESYL